MTPLGWVEQYSDECDRKEAQWKEETRAHYDHHRCSPSDLLSPAKHHSPAVLSVPTVKADLGPTVQKMNLNVNSIDQTELHLTSY